MFSYGEKTKKWLLLFLKFSVTISLIGIAAAYVDFEKFIQYVEKLSYGSFLLATLSLVVQIFVLGLRWQKILIPFHGHNLSYSHSLRIVFIGFFFNQTLPSSVGGDAMRAWEAYKCGLPPRTAVNSVLLERFSGLFTLVLIMAAVLPLIWHHLESSVIRWALVATVPLFAGIFVLILMLDRMPGAIRHISLVKKAATLSHDLRSVLANTEVTLQLLLLGVVSNLLSVAAVWSLGTGLGLDVALLNYMALVPAAILITVLPISVAGWGVREGAMVVLFTSIGVDREASLILSLMFGVSMLVASLPGGIFWLRDRSHLPGMQADPLKPFLQD